MGWKRGWLSLYPGKEKQGLFVAGSYFCLEEDANETREVKTGADAAHHLLPVPPASEALPDPAARTAQLRLEHAVAASESLPAGCQTTTPRDRFFRVCPFEVDRRMSAHKGLLPASYASTLSDLTLLPSGLVALSRYAIPYRISACCVFEITPGPGIPVVYAIAAGRSGLPGGGTEVFFPKGTPANTVRFSRRLSDR